MVLRIANSQTPIENLHILSAIARERQERGDPAPAYTDQDAIDLYLSEATYSIREKANKVILAVARRTEYFGHDVVLSLQNDYPLGYARNANEFFELLVFLHDTGLIQLSNSSSGASIKLTAHGIEAVELRSLCPPTTVFVSSTCHDLLDLRDELATHLEASGFLVKISEDPNRFLVDPTVDSIATCLRNLATSDVVICILDRRYGGVINGGDYDGLSATHAEIRFARGRVPPVPIYTFMRERAWLEFDALRHNPDQKTSWVEPNKRDQRDKWLALAKELIDLRPTNKGSNWVTSFKSVVDLKKLALKRLQEFRAGIRSPSHDKR